jgi:hypothetical protein
VGCLRNWTDVTTRTGAGDCAKQYNGLEVTNVPTARLVGSSDIIMGISSLEPGHLDHDKCISFRKLGLLPSSGQIKGSYSSSWVSQSSSYGLDDREI